MVLMSPAVMQAQEVKSKNKITQRESEHYAARKGVSKPTAPSTPSVSIDEKKELEQLRKEIRILREERDILKKAAAWFAQETGTPSSRRSSS